MRSEEQGWNESAAARCRVSTSLWWEGSDGELLRWPAQSLGTARANWTTTLAVWDSLGSPHLPLYYLTTSVALLAMPSPVALLPLPAPLTLVSYPTALALVACPSPRAVPPTPVALLPLPAPLALVSLPPPLALVACPSPLPSFL